MFFASDNASAVAPEIMAALVRAADGHAMPYGADELTRAVETRIREVFEAPEARVFLVATGTAANALALATLCPPWARVWCHASAHVEADECNAPEFYTGGAKLDLLPGAGGRIPAATLEAALARAKPGVVHAAQPGALSLTQATEAGTVYSLAELAALTGLARRAKIPVHLDGTRFANALARTGLSPADMSWRAGVDILCLGATKCGAIAAEAVIIFDPARAWEFELRRKRSGHLLSKMRFVAAQMLAWLDDGLWLRLAGQANGIADRLAAGLERAGVPTAGRPGANMVFARITPTQHAALTRAGAQYYRWPDSAIFGDDGPSDGRLAIRLVASFATGAAEVDRVVEILEETS